MKVKVRFDEGIREIEVTSFHTSNFSPPVPDLRGMFPDHIVVETLGPDADGVYYHVRRKNR